MWKCKYCIFDSAKRGVLLKHYRLKHGAHTKTVPFPCLHNDCLCTFNSISCLKVHLAKIHTKTQLGHDREIELVPLNREEILDDSASTADTVILSTSSQERKTQWPKEFEIPYFTVDVEYRLRQGNLAYLKDSTYLKLTKELKHDILEKLAENMFSFKAYPTNDDYAQVAAALVNKHPCLLESGSSTGWGGGGRTV